MTEQNYFPETESQEGAVAAAAATPLSYSLLGAGQVNANGTVKSKHGCDVQIIKGAAGVYTMNFNIGYNPNDYFIMLTPVCGGAASMEISPGTKFLDTVRININNRGGWFDSDFEYMIYGINR